MEVDRPHWCGQWNLWRASCQRVLLVVAVRGDSLKTCSDERGGVG
jgi:hypothetical protein